MDRFFVDPATWQQGVAWLAGDEAHHCRRVMRKAPGDGIEVFDGEGRWGKGTISGEDAGRVRVELAEEGESGERAPLIGLAVAIPKGKTMELIVQKAVELGVGAIQPLVTEHTVVRVEGSEDKKREKWQRVALEACKQCGQNVLPRVGRPEAFGEWLAKRDRGHCGLMASLAAGAVPLREAIGDLPGGVTEVDLLVGPEGDFSEGETEGAIESGWRPVSLGALTLRVETAVLFALSVLHYELIPSGTISTTPRSDIW